VTERPAYQHAERVSRGSLSLLPARSRSSGVEMDRTRRPVGRLVCSDSVGDTGQHRGVPRKSDCPDGSENDSATVTHEPGGRRLPVAAPNRGPNDYDPFK
jgi:hypothetical protein